MKKNKLHKDYCEIEECRENNSKVLHHHHIVEKTELGTSNSIWNLAVICSNCHHLIHAGEIKIIGVFPSTEINGRTLIYERRGVKNIEGITEAYFKPRAKKSSIF